jgi:hypothetical protein
MSEPSESKSENAIAKTWSSLSKGARTGVYVVAAIVALLVLSGLFRSCGSPAPIPTVTVTKTVTATVTATPRASQSPSAVATVAPAPVEEAPAETFEMPNLVGENLQTAQDILQSRGSFLLSQEDALPSGRSQLIDSNWYVCSQYPEPGATVSVSEFVTLWSVKLTESCP